MSQATADESRAPVGVLVVDDQPVFRRVAREVIEATGDFAVVGEAASGPIALDAVEELRPDLVLLDVRMDGMDGIETSRRLKALAPGAVVVLISVEDPLNLPGDVGFCGAADLVRKQDFRPALLRRLWRAHGPRRAP